MNVKVWILGIISAVILTACGDDSVKSVHNPSENVKVEKVIDISQIAGKPIDDVNKILGEPTSIEPVERPEKLAPKAIYSGGKFEVVYINGKADWITINDVSNLPMVNNILNALGIPETPPTFSNPSNVIRWTNIKGYKEISVFNNGSNQVDYIYIKIKTE